MTGVDSVVQAWKACCGRLAVPLVPAAPLLRPDPTVLLVNAGITPFKPAMLAGARLAPAAVIQPCLRTYWSAPGRFAFDMLTMVGMDEDAALAARLTVALVERLGVERRRLQCVVDTRDADLAAFAARMCPPEAIEFQDGNDDRYWTRWHFGEGDALVGRGLTLIHAEGRLRLSLGNLILVDHPASGRRYVDLGFGVERLASIRHAGDEWAPTAAAAGIARLVAGGMASERARDLANRASAMARMIDAGATPDAHGAGYLLRKLVRGTVDAAVTAAPRHLPHADAVAQLLADLPIFIHDPQAMSVVAIEAGRYLEQVERGWRALVRRARRTGMPPAQLDPAGTYGLPLWAGERLAAH